MSPGGAGSRPTSRSSVGSVPSAQGARHGPYRPEAESPCSRVRDRDRPLRSAFRRIRHTDPSARWARALRAGLVRSAGTLRSCRASPLVLCGRHRGSVRTRPRVPFAACAAPFREALPFAGSREGPVSSLSSPTPDHCRDGFRRSTIAFRFPRREKGSDAGPVSDSHEARSSPGTSPVSAFRAGADATPFGIAIRVSPDASASGSDRVSGVLLAQHGEVPLGRSSWLLPAAGAASSP